MIIRVLDENRANFCDELLTKLILDEAQYDSSINENFKVKDYFKNVIKDEKNILLCYEEDNIIKGYIFLKNNNNEYLIDGLYVEEEYRHNGIANKLIEYALNTLKELNINYVDINTMAKNEHALKLYKSFGFNEFRITLRKEFNN